MNHCHGAMFRYQTVNCNHKRNGPTILLAELLGKWGVFGVIIESEEETG